MSAHGVVSRENLGRKNVIQRHSCTKHQTVELSLSSRFFTNYKV